VFWQQAVGGQDFCVPLPRVVRLTKSWGDAAPIDTFTAGTFYRDGTVVVAFTVPSAPNSYVFSGGTSVAEYVDNVPTFRHVTLSKSSCDFRSIDPTGTNGPFTVFLDQGSNASISWNVGAPPVSLVPGQTYYVNIRNWSNLLLGGISCAANTCNVRIQFNWPH
jgi:hypothetical protein